MRIVGLMNLNQASNYFKKKKNSNLRVSVFLTNVPSQSKILCVLNKLFIAQHLCPREDNGCQALIMSLLQLINTS